MQKIVFLCAALLSAVSLVAGQDSSSTTTASITKAPTAEQTSRAIGELNSYLSDLRGKSEFASFSSLLGGTALPASFNNNLDIPQPTAIPEFSGLPTDAQNFFTSAAGQLDSLKSKDLSGAAAQPTAVLMAAGAAAAGVLGIAAMM